MTRLYLAYGSNMDEGQMAERCPDARLVGKSVIEDYRLLFKGSETGIYATIEPEAGKQVPVLVWDISEWDEKNLDEYERYPELYYKKQICVSLDGSSKEAMAYIMDESLKFGLPSEVYYDVLERAYQTFGFPMEILKEAHESSKNKM